MIDWAKLVGTTAWIMSASLACAGATPKPSAPRYYRSPPLDYVAPPISASDGEILGAQRQPPDDWLLGNPTTEHPAPGWSVEYGQLRFRQERAVAGRGVLTEAPPCEPPSKSVLAPDEAEAEAKLQRAWLSLAREPSLPVLASNVSVVPDGPSVLSCNRE
jgi:hypothetical protein